MRRRLGQRYEVGEPIGSGATSTVHLGRLLGTAGFTKLIAIKRPHPHLASDATLRALLVDEARLVSRISHPNVVGVLDVAEDDGELFVVLEYARGATLAELLAAGRPAPALAVAVVRDALSGLHAAHHARDAAGEPLGLVHRDVTPRNVVATTDGVGKILDFGVAKARARLSTTREGHVRGSLPYMAPEQIRDEPLGPRTDVYGASVVLWEALTGRRLFAGESEAAVIQKILDHDVKPPSTIVPALPGALDAVVLRGLASDPAERFASGLEMALALETSLAPAPREDVAAWVTRLKEAELEAREARISRPDDADADAGGDPANAFERPAEAGASERPAEAG
ncbi:MAG: serine/threonine protein kinase, partial [Labilithrix sp.]|nr:serine/threonine protein kinase [Labilithrix sp.]